MPAGIGERGLKQPTVSRTRERADDVRALVAALPGLVDLVGITNPKTKSIAIWHMLLNLLGVGVFAIGFGCECRGPLAMMLRSCFR